MILSAQNEGKADYISTAKLGRQKEHLWSQIATWKKAQEARSDGGSRGAGAADNRGAAGSAGAERNGDGRSSSKRQKRNQ